MSQGTLARRYARALFELAVEQDSLDDVLADLELVVSAIGQTPDFAQVLRDQRISTDRKEQLLEDTFKQHVQDLSYSFMTLLLRKRRWPQLQEIYEAFETMSQSRTGVTPVEIVTAAPLPHELVDRLREIVADYTDRNTDELEITVDEDPSLLGGFIVRVGEQRIDASLSRQLDQLRDRLRGERREEVATT